MLFLSHNPPLCMLFLNFFLFKLICSWHILVDRGKKKKKKHTNIHRKRERGNWKASQQKCDGIDIVDLSFGRCCSASGCQTSHWYGCHGKSAGLVHARQKENLMCCHSWIGFILVLEIHSSNASTWEEWITPAICQLICRFPPSAAQTYRGFCPFFFFFTVYINAGAGVLIRKELNPL